MSYPYAWMTEDLDDGPALADALRDLDCLALTWAERNRMASVGRYVRRYGRRYCPCGHRPHFSFCPGE